MTTFAHEYWFETDNFKLAPNEKDGRAYLRRRRNRVKLDNGGMWRVRPVNMQRCQTDCAEADWESFWGAITFGV